MNCNFEDGDMCMYSQSAGQNMVAWKHSNIGDQGEFPTSYL